MGAAVPPSSVCWHTELIVRGSGCHRAGTGDQNKIGEHQECARVGEMGRWQDTRDASHSLFPRCSDNAFDIQIRMERPAGMVPRDPKEC